MQSTIERAAKNAGVIPFLYYLSLIHGSGHAYMALTPLSYGC